LEFKNSGRKKIHVVNDKFFNLPPQFLVKKEAEQSGVLEEIIIMQLFHRKSFVQVHQRIVGFQMMKFTQNVPIIRKQN